MPWFKTSRQARGYGRDWEIRRLKILRRDYYLCQCKYCKAAGRITPANEVDHIIPKAKGGTDADANLQAINRECHLRKTNEDDRPSRRLAIGADGYPLDSK